MNILEPNNLDVLKQDNFSVVMIWANGCHFCEQAKPQFDALEPDFPDFIFYKIELTNDSFHNFYKQFEQEELKAVPSVDEDGEPILDAKGNQITVNRLTISTAVPKYYVFHGSEASEENPYGLLGKVEGHNLEQLKAILGQISEMAKQEENESGRQEEV
jgi:thiol-disulfide isomerase/thioredoxin